MQKNGKRKIYSKINENTMETLMHQIIYLFKDYTPSYLSPVFD